jgi:hypothetical protein
VPLARAAQETNNETPSKWKDRSVHRASQLHFDATEFLDEAAIAPAYLTRSRL